MQLLAIMAVLGLINIVGVGVASNEDLANRGMNVADYHASVEVEQVPASEPSSLMDAIRN